MHASVQQGRQVFEVRCWFYFIALINITNSYCMFMLQTVRQTGDALRIQEGASLPPTAPQWAPVGYYHAAWGEEHPDFEKAGAKRALWSLGEKDWIRDWIAAHPGKETGYAKCLADITADPAARCIFHPLHVLDSKRIRSGFEAVVKCL
jgi:hypothetical protein